MVSFPTHSLCEGHGQALFPGQAGLTFFKLPGGGNVSNVLPARGTKDITGSFLLKAEGSGELKSHQAGHSLSGSWWW